MQPIDISNTYIADLHIHSRYSRATSQQMNIQTIAYWACLKGIRLMGTGDFTHPEWFSELRQSLEIAENGLYRPVEKADILPETCDSDVYFVPSCEISCIYSKGGKTRKIHIVILMPTLEDVAVFNSRLAQIGNITSDGRPILGMDAKALVALSLDVTDRALIIPAHAWTPHFSVFGAVSGFDSLQECFEELTEHIYAIETGLSSDPPMNWMLSSLDNVLLVSNSDAHSPVKIGREANLISAPLSYDGLYKAIRTGEGFEGTIEFFPEEGKYHYDGHRNCNVCLSPEETAAHGGRCPVCGKKLTIGVAHRVYELSDRAYGESHNGAKPYISLIPLQEVIAEALAVGPSSKKTQGMYMKMVSELGPEFYILIEAPIEDIKTVAGETIAEGINRMRQGRVQIRPGYDGEYGKIRIFEEPERVELKGQIALF
ncbi:MAG: DNA helicase UvrD [Nitrospirae bacterium]|nr:DNA helicase UvrD [Nitrospirota bacterium]